MNDFRLPFATNIWVVLAIFVIALVIFDIVLVRWLKIGKRAWKRVDYVWLGITAIALVGAASQARQLVASGFLVGSEERVNGAFSDVVQYSDFFSTPVVCRTFVRSEFSPPQEEFDRAQRDYDRACQWFRGLKSAMGSAKRGTEIASSDIPPAPTVGQQELKKMFDGFGMVVESYNSQVRRHQELESLARRSELDYTLTLVVPLLLPLALALRITKVTGEIRLDV